MVKYYVDTCIWRDLFENRKDKFRPLGEWAFEFFRKAKENCDSIIISNFIVKELSKEYNYSQIKELFQISEENTIYVKASKKEIKEGIRIAKKKNISGYDGIHAILAKNNDAILISRDKHFVEISKIVETKKPEELI